MDLLRHLRYFVTVAEELHFGRAADRLHMAQSPLSQRIRTLERTLDAELLVRTTRRVELTPAGRVLLGEARAVLARVEQLELAMAGAEDDRRATLTAGMSPELSAPVLAGLLARLAARHPELRLRPVELPEGQAAAALIDRRVDLALVSWPPPAGLGHGATLVHPLGVLLAADAADPPANTAGASEPPRVALDALPADRPLVLPPRAAAPAHHDAILRGCHARGYAPAEILAASSLEFAAGLVLTSGAVALLEEPPGGAPTGTVWRALEGDPLVRAIVVARRPDDRRETLATAAEALQEALLATGRWRPVAPAAPLLRAPRPADAWT